MGIPPDGRELSCDVDGTTCWQFFALWLYWFGTILKIGDQNTGNPNTTEIIYENPHVTDINDGNAGGTVFTGAGGWSGM
jgi:hypothetical protein